MLHNEVGEVEKAMNVIPKWWKSNVYLTIFCHVMISKRYICPTSDVNQSPSGVKR
jgi:hypothetical protein